MSALLRVTELSVGFRTREGVVRALDHVSLEARAGEILGVVGESGSGKSTLAFSILGLLDAAAQVTSGSVMFDGRDLLAMRRAELEEIRGRDLSLVFQNPHAALNPIRSVGAQIADVIARHAPAPPDVVRGKTLEALRAVQIADPEQRSRAFPWELSGGMRQRVGIAIALACAPRLLIADEPTIGLDVTTQAAILDLLRDTATRRGVAIVLITHDLALASSFCDRVAVMHAGHIVETAPTEALFGHPRHPYSDGLVRSAPSSAASINDLEPIAGQAPDLRRGDLPPCRFSERCGRHQPVCDAPALALQAMGPDHSVLCRRPL